MKNPHTISIWNSVKQPFSEGKNLNFFDISLLFEQFIFKHDMQRLLYLYFYYLLQLSSFVNMNSSSFAVIVLFYCCFEKSIHIFCLTNARVCIKKKWLLKDIFTNFLTYSEAHWVSMNKSLYILFYCIIWQSYYKIIAATSPTLTKRTVQMLNQ